MKNPTMLFFILLLQISGTLSAQWKRETGLSVGIVSPLYPENRFYYEYPGVLMKLGFAQSWHKPEQQVSFRPEITLSVEILPIDYSHGGKGAMSTHKGTIVAINGGLAPMAQIRIFPRTSLAVGPSAKFLLTDITHTVYTYNAVYIQPAIYTSKEFNGFNREYLNKPSIGIKAMLIQQNLNEKVNMGAIFDYQWKKSEEEYFHFSRTMEISFYLGLR